MAAASMRQQKRHSLRRIAAKNFLSNISLDGTHSDTNFSIFNWKYHKIKEDAKEKENAVSSMDVTPPTSKTSFTSQISSVSEASKDETAYTNTSKYPEYDPQIVTPARPRAQTMGVKSTTVTESTDSLDRDRDQRTKRWRTGSYSGDREKATQRRRLVQLAADHAVPIIREYSEKDRSSRRSSSLSGDSSDSRDHEIRFLSPDSRRKIRNERVLIVSGRKAPVVISSTVPYKRQTYQGGQKLDSHEDATSLVGMRNRHPSGTRSISSQEELFLLGQHIVRGEDTQDISYSELLIPSKKHELKRSHSENKLVSSDSLTVLEEDEEYYEANLLDDPELQSGGYRTVLNLSSYMTSVIDYVKPSTLKKELNEKFRERFPNIQLTLTKLRSLKREMRQIGHQKCNIDLWTVAQAHVFFEKLILKLLITKANRKLCAGACLMLSAKLNDMKGHELSRLIENIEESFRLHRKEMLTYEFACLVALEFSLHIADSEIYPHYQRLLYQS